MEVSVITAVYNGEDYLEESINSILRQTFQAFEYIIVNDNSNDRTKELLDRVTDPRVKVIHLEKNGGAANALNIGINEAKGKWIALQDADDISIEYRLQRQLQYATSDSRIIAVGSFIQCIPGDESIAQSALEWEERFFNDKEHFRDDQFYSTPICHGTGFFLKQALNNVGGYDPAFRIAYDYDFWTRMFEEGEIVRVPEVLYKYRIRRQSLAHRNNIDTMNEVLLSTLKCISQLRYKHLMRKPKLLLLGSKRDFRFYKDNLESRNHYLTMDFFKLELRDLKQAYSLYRSKEVDGIILVSNHHIERIVRFFTGKGMLLGFNLFKICIP